MNTSDQRPALDTTSSPGPRRAGFTLVEIMVVFAIIAILIVIVTWASRKYIQDAKVKQTRAVMGAIAVAMNECRLATGGLPQPPQDPDPQTNPPRGGTLPPTDPRASFRTDFYREKDDVYDTWWKDPASNDPPAEGIEGKVAYSVNMMNTADKDFKADKRRIYGIQALYCWLSSEPNSKRYLEKVPASNLAKAQSMKAAGYLEDPGDLMCTGAITSPGKVWDALVFVDAWGRPMFYGQEASINNGQEYLQSAGPDGRFGDADDVYSFGR